MHSKLATETLIFYLDFIVISFVSHSIFCRPLEALQIVLCLAFGMAIEFAGFGFQTVMERTTKAKHIQFVSGACVLTYWLSALLCDLICFSILCCLFLVSVR